MNLREKLAKKIFVYTLELDPPINMDIDQLLVNIKTYLTQADAINITDCPLACLRMSPIALSHIIQEKIHLETIFHITCRDRNILALKSELLGAYALGVKNILALSGDHPRMGDHPDATPVFDLDSTGLVKMIHELNQGHFTKEKISSYKTDFSIGVAGNPSADDPAKEIKKLAEKFQAGANFIQTQPVFSLDVLENFLHLTRNIPIPKIIGIMPLKSNRMIQYISRNLPHIYIPEEIKSRMENAGIEEGIRIAQELTGKISSIKEVAGIHFFPMNQLSIIPQLIRKEEPSR